MPPGLATVPPPALHLPLPLAPAVDSTAVAAAAAVVVVVAAAVADDACGGGYCSAGECELIQSAIREKEGLLT